MIDRLLEDKESLKADQEILDNHVKENLLEDGASIDYQERNALHYHVYNLETWLEIALLEPDYIDQVSNSYDFLIKQLKADNIYNQFAKSKQKIDEKRAKGGFSYAKKGGTFDTKRVTRSVISYSTLKQEDLESQFAAKYLDKKKIKQSLFQYIRYFLWKNK